MKTCAQPLSWLALERYALGEVAAGERRRLDEHLAACSRCRSDLDAILADERSLPALQARASASTAAPRARSWIWALATGLSAVLALGVIWFLQPAGERAPAARITYKGGELAISLVRERGGQAVGDPRSYRPGDRLAIRSTCPPGLSLQAEVIVFEDGRAQFPMERITRLPTGNARALPGAMRLLGRGPVTICLLVAEDLPPRADLAKLSAAELPPGRVCAGLDAEAP